jgi:hypothetical protein
MVSAHETMAISQPRVPAWKRIGLKLKYAKDNSEAPPGTPIPNPKIETTKPPVTLEGPTNDRQQEDQRPVKRRKVSKEPSVRNGVIDHTKKIKPNDYSDNSNHNGIRQDTQRADAVEPSKNDQAVLLKE